MHYFLAHRAKFKGTFFSSFFWKSLLNSFANPLFSSFLPYIFISLIFGHSFTYATYLCLRHITSFRMFFCISTARFYLKKLHYSVFFSLLHFKSIFWSFLSLFPRPRESSRFRNVRRRDIFRNVLYFFFVFFSQQNLIVWSSIFGAFVTEKLWFSRSKSIETEKTNEKMMVIVWNLQCGNQWISMFKKEIAQNLKIRQKYRRLLSQKINRRVLPENR